MDMFYVRIPHDREAEAEKVAGAGSGVTFEKRPDGVYLGAPLDQHRALGREARAVLAKFDERIRAPRPRDEKGKLIKPKRAKRKAAKPAKAKAKPAAKKK